jgi:peptidoglycan/LPS O-acetylase OafA/YrhL
MSTDTNSPSRHNFEHLTHPPYRADIDGLRAVAVLSVVAFHAFPLLLRGGFIGVDIFFVISGFLISTIILGSLARNSFSFVEFYSRRIKRIFPALILVLASCFVFGWFVLITDEYKQLGKHIAGGAGFVSNFLFLNERGYFDNAAETKPLLHLWSLGVEEQFYIVWPLLLWLAWKLRFNLLILMIAVAAISFALNINSVSNNAVAAFYSPQTRFWELLMGAVLAHMTLNRQNVSSKLEVWLGLAKMSDANRNWLINIQSISGAVLMVAAALIITRESSFPGWWAVLPTMGTVLIILAGSQAWLNRVVLSSRILVWFGLISYPLYLWHWPLLSFAHIVEADIPSIQIRVGLVLISIALAWLTYRWIEKPIRLGGYSEAKTIALFVLMATVGYVGYNCYERDGLGFRLKDRQAFSEYFENSSPEWKYFKKINLYENYREDCSFFNDKEYRLGNPTEIPRAEISSSCFEGNSLYSHAVFVWGDSYAQQLNFGLKKQLPPNWQILQVASSDCRPNVDNAEPSATDFCSQSNWFALKAMSEAKPDVVIVAQVIGHNAKEFSHMAEKLKELGVKKIIFAGVAPHWKTDLPKIILNKLWFNTPNRTYQGISAASITNNEKLQQQFQQTETVLFANLLGCFCNQDGCLTYVGDDKKTGITSWDKGHLTPIASDYLAKNLLVDLIVGNNKAK